MTNTLNLIYDIDSKIDCEAVETVNESDGKACKKYYIRGVFSTIGEKNRNGRVYPKNLWESEIAKYQGNIQTGSLNTLMEWEHPARTVVDPMQAVAKITKLKIDNNYVMGEAVLLDNEKSNQIKSLIENGVKISVSSRGVGKVNNGVVEQFQLVTYDLVSDPSDFNATMNGCVENFSLNEGIVQNVVFKRDQYGNILQEDILKTDNADKAIKDYFTQLVNNF